MANASTLDDMAPGLVKGVERAQREPEGRFHALAHVIDGPALERAYRRQRAVRRRRVTGSPSDRNVSRRGEGLPGYGTVLFVRAMVEHPAGDTPLLAQTPRMQRGVVAFR